METLMFRECISCKRNLESKSELWADMERRICVCCDCFGYEKDLIGCKRQKCKLHKHLDHDYITYEKDMKKIDVEEPVIVNALIKDYSSETSTQCFKCDAELRDFIFINAKFTKIFYDEETQPKDRVKIKVCMKCWEEMNKFYKAKV